MFAFLPRISAPRPPSFFELFFPFLSPAQRFPQGRAMGAASGALWLSGYFPLSRTPPHSMVIFSFGDMISLEGLLEVDPREEEILSKSQDELKAELRQYGLPVSGTKVVPRLFLLLLPTRDDPHSLFSFLPNVTIRRPPRCKRKTKKIFVLLTGEVLTREISSGGCCKH